MSDAGHRPVDPATGEPLPARAQPGYFPGLDTLSQAAFWDEATRSLVRARMDEVPPIRFFSPGEARLLAAVFDRLIPQDDRDAAHRIPILPWVDERLFAGRGDGYRYEKMPPDGEAYRLGIGAIDAIARVKEGAPFLDLDALAQERVLETLHAGQPPAAPEVWARMPPHRFFLLVLSDAVSVYYAHPWAWDEIGFGGPSYPRGYMRLERGAPEDWEVAERRYAWDPPLGSPSGKEELLAGTGEHGAPSGQGGTH